MTQNLQIPSKSPLAVNNTHSENQDVLNSSNLSAGMKTYVGTIRSEEKKKSYIVGDSNLNRICKNKFKEITPNARVYVKCFSGANTNQLDCYVVPVLLYEKPDNVIIYIGSNEITKFNYNNVDAEELSNEFINNELKCRTNGLSNAAVSFILKRNSFNMNQVIYQLNRILKRFFSINDFFYLCNDEINENYLWKDGLDLIYEGSSLLLNNVINYFNRKGINSV